MSYRSFPKIELHLHLDCSLSFDVVNQIDPSITKEDYQKHFVAPSYCTSLNDYITRALRGVELMQTKEQLRLVTLDLFEQLKADHVIYAEIRFAPLLHLNQGLTAEKVVRAVNDAAEEGVLKTGVEAGIILCTLRHYSEEESMQTVKLANAFKGTRIVGFDIAADEAGFPIDNHVAAFRYAEENGIPCTAHAGEVMGPESVRETLEHFGPSRIGHGVRSAEDEKLLEYLQQEKIHLEVCPTSNIHTNVFNRIGDHTADKIYRSGVSMSINTDGRTVSDVTLAQEYKNMEKAFNWNLKHFRKCNLEAIEHAFTSTEMKNKLRSVIIEAYQDHKSNNSA